MSFAISLIASLAPFATPDGQASVQQWREDAQILKAASAPLDAAGLHKYLAPQTVTNAQLTALRDKLDDTSFQSREQAMKELIRLGRQAVPVLREAVKAGSEEMRRRAEKCLEQIDQQNRPETALAAARRLAGFPSDEVLTTLMHFLPQAGSEEGSEHVVQALHQMMKAQGRLDPRSAKYLSGEGSARREAAAYLIGALGSAKQRADLVNSLDKKAFDMRFQAARGLLAARDKAAVPVLLDLLERCPLPLAALAQENLQFIAGLKGPDERTLAAEADRKPALAAWNKWQREYGATLVLDAGGLSLTEQKAQAKALAAKFIKAANAKDVAALDRIIKYPIFTPGAMPPLQKREDFLKGVNTDGSEDLNFTLREVVTLESFKKQLAKRGGRPDGLPPGFSDVTEEAFKNKSLRQGDLFAHVELTPKKAPEILIHITMAFVIRPYGDRQYVVGLVLVGFKAK